jgi:2,3-bisphosphoglycerate-independent phosphoglycerate mutase
MKNKAPTLLCILDGLGLNPNSKGNAVAAAKKPTLDRLFTECPWTTLATHGTQVGLPDAHMGNSEVGHLNIGAGRVVEQWLYRISRDLPRVIAGTTFETKQPIHIIGLFSHGGVHSDLAHMKILCEALINKGAKKIQLHIIADGRDTPPMSVKKDLLELAPFLDKHREIQIASLSGRFYSMDRDKRWERTEQAFNTIALGHGKKIGPSVENVIKAIEQSYAQNISDEFIEPVTTTGTQINKDDLVIFYNFRADRMRQIVAALCQDNFSGFARSNPTHERSKTLCMTSYDETFNLPCLFEATTINNHLGEVVSRSGLTQLRTAETEKYPHVTYFLNGLIEPPLPGESREMVPSPRDVKTYDLKPEMSAAGVEEIVVRGINSNKYDLIVVNFANCDMVGHTGIIAAATKAVEIVDGCLGRILEALANKGGKALVIADHGNAEQMVDYETGLPHTAHTTFPVPAILFGYDKSTKLRAGGALCDVAPTLLQMLGVTQPAEMTGSSLLKS